jgi:CheY-like chemotaxis protein
MTLDSRRPITVLLADDDPDDQLLVREAIGEVSVPVDLRVVADGLELLDYLRRRGKYVKTDAPKPHIILLDLNMPRMSGHEALAEIKQDPKLQTIPVVVLTTSSRDEDVIRTYELGANSFITKPSSFPALVEVMNALDKYWFRTVEMPANRVVS